jgi:hypothetical protein
MPSREEAAQKRIEESKKRKKERFDNFITKAMTRKFGSDWRLGFCCTPFMPPDVIQDIASSADRFANTVIIIDLDTVQQIAENWGWICSAKDKVHVLTEDDVKTWIEESIKIIEEMGDAVEHNSMDEDD